MNRPLKLKTIGILGGMTSQATVEYYKAINEGINNIYGGHDIAETLIAGVNFGNIEYYVRNEKWNEAKEYLYSKAVQLQAGSADFLVCASNTMHKVLNNIDEIINIPFIHIATPTLNEINKTGLQRIGLIGTKTVMKENFISDIFKKNEIEVNLPSLQYMDEIDRILFDETSRGIIEPSSKKFMNQIIQELLSDGAQGIVLACTELFLLVNPSDFPSIPILDTTKLHVQEIIRFAVENNNN